MMDYSYLLQLNDEELWRLTVSGDARAEEELIERYTRLVRICARPYFLAGGDSEDLTQEGLMGLLNAGGTLAVQIPSQAKHPMHHLLTETAHGARWQGKITSFRQYNELTEEEYFDALSENASAFRMWGIMYFFEMPSHESILEWYRGTGLRPYLAQLCDEDKTAFEAEILDGIRKLYPVQKNGSIIFRFPRLFFAARK